MLGGAQTKWEISKGEVDIRYKFRILQPTCYFQDHFSVEIYPKIGRIERFLNILIMSQ